MAIVKATAKTPAKAATKAPARAKPKPQVVKETTYVVLMNPTPKEVEAALLKLEQGETLKVIFSAHIEEGDPWEIIEQKEKERRKKRKKKLKKRRKKERKRLKRAGERAAGLMTAGLFGLVIGLVIGGDRR